MEEYTVRSEYFTANGVNNNAAAAQVNAASMCYKDASFFSPVFNLTTAQLKVWKAEG